jgi:nucleoid DNA-binding protein
MEKSINALLNSNLRVIIPDFGAFIIKQKDPRIIVFNEFLRYNDGLLIEAIAKSEGVELETARQLVADYVLNVTKLLDSGKGYKLKGIGMLEKDSSGKVVFESEGKDRVPDKTSEIELELPDTASEEERSQLKNETRRTGRKVPAARNKPVTPEKKVEEPIPVTPQDDLKENSEEPVPESPVTIPEEVPVVATPEVTPAEPEPSPAVDQVEGESRPEKSSLNIANLVVKLVILVLLANAAVIAWFVLGDKIRGLFKEKEEVPAGMMDSIFQDLTDSVRLAATDTAIIFREAPALESGDETQSAEELRYYIVAGCFRDEINADELVKSLRNKGFNAEKFGKIGNLHAVSFASFSDKEMAVKELKRIREEIFPEAWMTRF